MILKNDIISCIKKDKKDLVYGKAGDVVVVISDYGNVVIVENTAGERFPCGKDDLLTVKIKKKWVNTPASLTDRQTVQKECILQKNTV